MPENELTQKPWAVLVETDRLLIRRFEAGDEQMLERIFCDPEMMRYLGAPWDAPQLAEALQEWRADWGVANRWHGMLVRKDTAQAVGTAGIADGTLRGEPGYELTWFVLPEHQRRGYAAEISRVLLRLAFDSLHAERVVAETHPDNPGANRLLHRLGFTCLGERRCQYADLPGFDRQAVWGLTRHTHRLEQIISRVPAWQSAREIRSKRIAGLTNSNYRVTVDGESFVLRISGENTTRLGIDRTGELTALQAAAAAGLGPQVVAYLPPEGHLVTRWIDGRHWEASEFRTAEHVRLLTRTVKAIHALPLAGTAFSPFHRIETFLETAIHFGAPTPENIRGFLESMQAVRRDQNSDSSGWQRFCHNDLAAVNYLFCESDNRIRVLDWEFAGPGDIYYDLATVVYTHDSEGPIPTELEEVMLEEYFGQVTDWRRRRLLGMKYLLTLFSGMWGLAQHGMQQAGLIPAPEDFDYLEFAQALFASDIANLQGVVAHSS